MTLKRRKPAWNRGTAVHLGEARVRLIWPCGCSKVETITSPSGPLSSEAVRRLVLLWRHSGVTLPQCKKHPDYYTVNSQIERLNLEHPQPYNFTLDFKRGFV